MLIYTFHTSLLVLPLSCFSRVTIQSPKMNMMKPWPKSPNITENRNGNEIMVKGAATGNSSKYKICELSCPFPVPYSNGSWWGTPFSTKLKNVPQNQIWWQEFWGWCWIQYKTLMTFCLIEYFEYVLRCFLDRSFSCTKVLCSLVDSQSENVLPKLNMVTVILGLILNTIQNLDDLFLKEYLK